MQSLLKKYKNIERTTIDNNNNNNNNTNNTSSSSLSLNEQNKRIRNDNNNNNNRDRNRNRNEDKIVDFLIIGAQKAGTTSLVKNLNKHFDIFVKNECQFFTFCWSFGIDWYRKQLTSTKKIIGEKTPEIIYCDDCAPRVKEICPNAKFILCLRDPIKRAFSSWNMEISTKKESLSFSECVERELNTMMNERRTYGTAEYHFIQRGFYMDQIERFQRTFPDKSKLLIVIAEKLQANPAEEYTRIIEFLGASNFTFIPEDDNVGEYKSLEINPKTLEKLKEIYSSHNQRLFSYMGIESIPEWEDNWIPPSSNEERDYVTTSAREVVQVQTETEIETEIEIENTKESISNHSFQNSIAPITLQGDLATLGTSTGTDKITHHGYHRYYPLYLERFRLISEPWGMLEIGIDESKSLEMWVKYFPSNVFIYGLDIGVSRYGERYHIFQADQSKVNELESIITTLTSTSTTTTTTSSSSLSTTSTLTTLTTQQNPSIPLNLPIHFILDDGSHIPEHQVLTFNLFFPSLLSPGGVYIIEDIETSYWTHGKLYGYSLQYGYHHSNSLIEIFKDLVDDINTEFLIQQNRNRQDSQLRRIFSFDTRLWISTITFGQNCVIITKKTIEEKNEYSNRRYRYDRNL